jgi:hypothetical protein
MREDLARDVRHDTAARGAVAFSLGDGAELRRLVEAAGFREMNWAQR